MVWIAGPVAVTVNLIHGKFFLCGIAGMIIIHTHGGILKKIDEAQFGAGERIEIECKKDKQQRYYRFQKGNLSML